MKCNLFAEGSRQDILFVRMMRAVVILIVFSSCSKNYSKKESAEQVAGRENYKLALAELTGKEQTQGVLRRALDYAQRAVAHDQQYQYQALVGTLLLKLGSYPGAIKIFQELIEQLSGKAEFAALNAEIKNNLACAFMSNGDAQKALWLWQELVADCAYTTPEVALLNQAKWYLNSQEYETALTRAQDATAAAPDYIDAHFFTALIALKLQDKTRALQALSLVQSLGGSSVYVKKLLTMIT